MSARAQEAGDDFGDVREQRAFDLVVDEVEERAGDQPHAGGEDKESHGAPARGGGRGRILRSARGKVTERERRSGEPEGDGQGRADAGAEDGPRRCAESETGDGEEGEQLDRDQAGA